MREVFFLKQNRDKWREFEEQLQKPKTANPDEVVDLFIQVNDDLSYARTFYPKSNTVRYLNQLAGKVYLNIYRNKREPLRRIWDFWAKEVPQEVIRSKTAFIVSTVVFILMVLVGILSNDRDPNFAESYFGTGYVRMTEENIRSGNPTGVYQNEDMITMFLRIGYNNLRVDINSYVSGFLCGVGTLYVLVYNAIMIGTFFSFFYQYNVHWEAWRIIMIHGTIEISTVIIACAAGFAVGGGILFPGTYSRKHALKDGAMRGLKIIFACAPFTVIAAFLEAFVTRYANMPLIVNLLILLLSAVLMIGYWFFYPIYLYRKGHLTK
jgi:uncharacterized membrane protein SpoIIM required for sporulation